jgi:hypothetical protein
MGGGCLAHDSPNNGTIDKRSEACDETQGHLIRQSMPIAPCAAVIGRSTGTEKSVASVA